MIDDRVYINEKGVASILENEDDWEVVGSNEEKDEMDDISQQRKEGAKDRLWPMSGLREVHTRRLDSSSQLVWPMLSSLLLFEMFWSKRTSNLSTFAIVIFTNSQVSIHSLGNLEEYEPFLPVESC